MLQNRRFNFKLTTLILTLTYAVGNIFIYPIATHAESIQIFATIAVDESDFQLELSGPSTIQTIGPNSLLNFKLTYGSKLRYQTDLIVLKVSWAQDMSLPNILEYVSGSASAGLGNAQPVIDTNNRTITWQISPMPATENNIVSWQLKTTSAAISNFANVTISASLIATNIEKKATPLTFKYASTAAPVKPTPSAIPNPTPQTSPNPTVPITSPAPSQPIAQPETSISLLEHLNNISKDIAKIINDISNQNGSLIASPIPLLLVIIPSLTPFISLLGQVPWWQIIPLLMALFWAKPKHAWGVIFDSQTKQPIDPAIITLTNSNGQKWTTISDIYGRYQFLVEPGQYSITVKKTNYQFPSRTLMDVPTDGVYDNMYFGGEFKINESGSVIYNIPMDSIAPDWNQSHKSLSMVSWWPAISNWLFWTGFMWSFIMLSFQLSLINCIVFGSFVILILLRYIQRIRSPWGVVYNQHGKPISSAMVNIINQNNPLSKRPPVVTRTGGRYVFLVENGTYQLQVSLKSESGFTQPNPGPIIQIKGKQACIATDLTVSTPSEAMNK